MRVVVKVWRLPAVRVELQKGESPVSAGQDFALRGSRGPVRHRVIGQRDRVFGEVQDEPQAFLEVLFPNETSIGRHH